eukprot:GHVS01081265.1.p1 GENE.GHVS01081265.1~~GHVS01081265.1.p1  ORF type:complete len:492 (-),score=106.34 GHVS01081265.1:420-1895(-)
MAINTVENGVPAGIDITGDGGILKSVLKEASDGAEQPQDGEEVTVHYTGTFLSGDKFDSSVDRGQPFKFCIGRGEVIRGWDVGVKEMKVGEKSRFTVRSDYGYGERGMGGTIPADATLVFEVELLGSRPKPKEKFDMTPEEKMQSASEDKEQGNDAYRREEFQDAIGFYSSAVDTLSDMMENPDQEEEERISALVRSCQLNLANSYGKTGQWSESASAASKAVELDPTNTKGLFRRGVARMMIGSLVEARADLMEAQRLDSENVEVKRELANCKRKLVAEKEKEKTAFGRIFGKGGFYNDKPASFVTHDFDKLPKVFLEVKIGDGETKRLEIALFTDTVPKTAENFRALCTGEKGDGKQGTPLHFKGNKCHRVIKGFMMQAGDITQGNGMGGESIYGDKFKDEAIMEKHTERGILSMANCGPNTNSSQFFICFKDAPHLDGKHVVFAKVVSGLEVLDEIENIETGDQDKPTVDVVIVDCGEVAKSAGETPN